MAERRESVRLELHDSGFSTGMAKDAASVLLLERALKSLDGTTVNVHQRISESATSVDSLSRSSRDADGSINQLTGRLRVLGEVAAILGPGATPVGGVAIAGISGLASQMGFAAVAGGVLIGSLQGVGDALSAMNKAQLDPTTANLEKAEAALRALSPAARDFAKEAFALKPALVALRDLGAEALLPGLTESLDSLERLGPRVGAIMEAVAGALGDIADDSAASLASERWAGFFEFIEREAPDAITELATTVGSLTHGLVELWEAFGPLNDDFSSWLMDVAAGFDDWATGLSATRGFTEFVEYIRTTGPQVADTFGAIGSAVVQIVQATAPLGGPVLAGLEALANVVAAIADSDIGTPILAGVAALSLLNRTLAVTKSLSSMSLSTGLFAGIGTLTGATGGAAAAGSPLLQVQKMPAALKAAASAQDELVAAQKRASSVTANYVGQLQAVNTATSKGFKPSMQTLNRLTGSLDDVEAANRDVAAATARAADAEEKRRGAMKASAAEVGKGAALMGGLALASSGAADSIGLTNTMSLALMGTLVPGGVVIGAAAGLLLDLRAAGEGATEAITGLGAAVQSGNLDLLKQQVAAAKTELEDINNLDFNAGDIFDRITFQVADTFGGPSADDAQKKIDAAKQAVEDLTEAEKAREVQSRASAIAYASEVGFNTELSTWRRKSVEEIKAQADALAKVREEGSKVGQSFLTFDDSLSKAKATIGDFIADMNESTEAMANFNTNSLKAAKKGIDEGLIASLRQLGPEGAVQLKNLANATEEQVARANRAYRRQQRELENTIDVTAELAGYSPIDLKVNTNTKGAMNDIAGLEARLRAIKDEDVFVNVRQITTTSLGPRTENAMGDVKNAHSAEIAPGGAWRVWAEPETGGESYIPHANDHRRPRARNILEQTAGILGGEVQWYADGGVERKDGKKKRKRGFDFSTEPFDTTKLEDRILQLTSRVADQTKATERDVATRDAWAQKMAEVAQATVAGFNTGLFDTRDIEGDNPWMAGARGPRTEGNPLDNLTRDIAGLQERGALQQQLAGMGLTGEALAALLSEAQGAEGNAQITAMIQSGQIEQYAALFNQRAALQGSVGAAGGQAAFGQQFDIANKAANASLAAQNRIEARLRAAEGALNSINAYMSTLAEDAGAAVGFVLHTGAAEAARNRNRRGART